MSDYTNCQQCGRSGGAWREDARGVKYTVSASYGDRVGEGEAWTCRICKGKTGFVTKTNQNHEQNETANPKPA